MSYRKFKADHLFTGKILLNNGHVLIADEHGKIIDIVNESEAGEDIQAFKGIISPGFINAHCHLELSYLKGIIPEKKGLVDFVFNVVTNRNFEQEKIKDAIVKAEQHMINCGIVATGDICNTDITLAQKQKKNIAYHTFIEVSGWHPSVADSRFAAAENYLQGFLQNNLSASLVPHAPYSVSENLWEKIATSFPHNIVSIHNQESKAEDEFFINGSGAFTDMYAMMKIDNSFYTKKNIRSVETYFKKLGEASSVILVHNTFIQQEDINFLNKNKFPKQLVSFCLCPNANLYIEDALPPVELLMQNNCNIIIGTDSLASNYQLSILEELKTIADYFKFIPVETLLQWATLNGARSLLMDDKLGSFDKGKTPGIILIQNITNKNLSKSSEVKKLL